MFSAAATLSNGEQHFWRDEFSGLKRLCADESVDKVFHNAKFDLRMLEWAGIKVKGRVWDTMIFAHLLDNRQELGLEPVSIRYLPSDKRKVVAEINQWFDEQGFGSKERYEKFGLLPPELLRRRNVGDTELTAELFKKMYSTVMTCFPLLVSQEHALIPVVKGMEDRGICIREEELDAQEAYFEKVIDEVTLFCEGVVGRDSFNPNSPTDQQELLEMCGLYDAIEQETDASGKWNAKRNKFNPVRKKLDDLNLRMLRHPVSAMLVTGRAAQTMMKFIRQARKYNVNGVLHANFNPLGTRTGRFSCAAPNLMNLPIEGDTRANYTSMEAEEVYEMTGIAIAQHSKQMFGCRPGFAHVHSDKSRAELVVVGHYTGDKVLSEIMLSGQDVHEQFCMRLFGEMNKGLRTRTKRLVFGYLYGAGNKTLAKNMGASIQEAAGLRARFLGICPGLRKWSNSLQSQIEQRGYVETDFRRRFYFTPSEGYMAVNSMCQAHVADEIKSRMIALDAEKGNGGRLQGSQQLLMVHDDIATEVLVEDRHRQVKVIHEIMHDTALPCRLPMPSSLDITYTTWGHLKEIKDVNNIPEPVVCDNGNRPVSGKSRNSRNTGKRKAS